MKVDVLSAEIGSTTTIVSAFDGLAGATGTPRLLGQGAAATTVETGDVRVGLEAAIAELRRRLGAQTLEWGELFAGSSAAGGLRMSVHGLAYEMTVKAAREAALGAGANVCLVTAGVLRESDLPRIRKARPSMIMLAGGVDYGDRDTALHNARLIRDHILREQPEIPVLYAGNRENRDEIREIFAGPSPAGAYDLTVTENVYPRIDELVVTPARTAIQAIFERKITGAPGMAHIREMVDGSILPVPGAVMRAAAALREELGDLLVIDVGGATTDVHSVCADSPEVGRLLIAPEPEAKRSVEGDLGLYVNRRSLLEAAGPAAVARGAGVTEERGRQLCDRLGPLPETGEERRLARELAFHATRLAMRRHAGVFRDLYTISGKERRAEGKDLTGVGTIVATGGALTHLDGQELIRRVLETAEGNELFPPRNARILIDRDYVMAALGVTMERYPQGATRLLLESLAVVPDETPGGGTGGSTGGIR